MNRNDRMYGEMVDHGKATIHLVDKAVDPTWLELTIEDLWDLVKDVRRKSGHRERKYALIFDAVQVEVTVRRVSP